MSPATAAGSGVGHHIAPARVAVPARVANRGRAGEGEPNVSAASRAKGRTGLHSGFEPGHAVEENFRPHRAA